MTVSSVEPVNNYAGNSSNKKFDFDFLIENESELVVQYTDSDGKIAILQQGIDYSINEIGNKNGSYITFPISSSSYGVLQENEKLSLMLSLVIQQENEIRNSLFFNFDTLEWMFDYIVRVLQILNRQVIRCVKVNEGSSQTADEVLSVLNQAQFNVVSSANRAANSAQSAETNARNVETWYNALQGIERRVDECSENISVILSAAIEKMHNMAEELGETYLEKADGSLQQLTPQGHAKFQYAPFAINNGTVLNGQNNTLTYSNAVLSCSACTITTADGRTKKFNDISTYNCANLSNATYKVFKNYETGDLITGTYVVTSKSVPTVNMNYWLDTSQYPLKLKKYENGEWLAADNFVYIGDVTVSNGVIADVKNRYFNACSARHDMLEGYRNGTNWYRIYSDGWCEQGGVFGVSVSTNSYTVQLLKSFMNTDYQVFTKYKANVPVDVDLQANYQEVNRWMGNVYSYNLSSFTMQASSYLNAQYIWMAQGFVF